VIEAIKIDTSDVPQKMLADPLFLFCLADVRAKLADPNEVKAICIHEAAHLLYMTKAGMRDPEFSGPKIVYNPQTGRFDRYGATVRCPNRDEKHISTLTVIDWVFQLAKAHAAGGVAIRLLANYTGSGDSEDRENFDRAYNDISTDRPLPMTADELWKEAHRILWLELNERPRQEFILSLAETIRPELFKS
jgi:hypothetical protein